jgi:hypothetical protein
MTLRISHINAISSYKSRASVYYFQQTTLSIQENYIPKFIVSKGNKEDFSRRKSNTVLDLFMKYATKRSAHIYSVMHHFTQHGMFNCGRE